MEEQNFYLQAVKGLLDSKRARNSNYSVRALARDLKMDSSNLVNILHGKRKVTPHIAFKLATNMKLEGIELLNFILPSLQ